MKGMMLAVLVLGLAGCVSFSDVVQERLDGEGTAEIYPISADRAWEVTRAVFRWEGGVATEERPGEGYLMTTLRGNAASYGALAGVWIEPLHPMSTRVTVITKRRVQTNIITPLTELGFHRRFRQALDLIQRGQPVPVWIQPPTPISNR